jgi:hypothetical protein
MMPFFLSVDSISFATTSPVHRIMVRAKRVVVVEIDAIPQDFTIISKVLRRLSSRYIDRLLHVFLRIINNISIKRSTRQFSRIIQLSRTMRCHPSWRRHRPPKRLDKCPNQIMVVCYFVE